MLKWLGIAVVVLASFLIILLGLGYLLKENKAETTILKQKLDQQTYQKQVNQQQKIERQKIPSLQALTPIEQSLQQIISSNLSCKTNKQCILFDTGSQALGCTVAVNIKGAAILIKTTGDTVEGIPINSCHTNQTLISIRCIAQRCLIQ